MDGGLWTSVTEIGVCVLVFAFTCWIVAGIVLQRSEPKWLGFLIVGASALLLSLASNAFLSSLVAARATIRHCPGCGLGLIAYGLRVDTTLLAAMSLAGAACATAAWIAWDHRWWVLVSLLALGVVLPPLIVVGYVTGPIRPLMATGYNVERVVIGQALLVLLFGIGLLFRRRPSAPGRRPDASMAGNESAE